jgi:hypothetical protein
MFGALSLHRKMNGTDGGWLSLDTESGRTIGIPGGVLCTGSIFFQSVCCSRFPQNALLVSLYKFFVFSPPHSLLVLGGLAYLALSSLLLVVNFLPTPEIVVLPLVLRLLEGGGRMVVIFSVIWVQLSQ